MPPVIPAPKLAPIRPRITATPPVMYSHPFEPQPSTTTDAPELRSAMHVWARVISRPEPGLALLDIGRRDVSFDEGLPTPQLVADQLGAPSRPLDGGEITAVNDQHAFLRIPPDSDLRVGDVVRLGLSHPCTAFDKWQWIPLLDDAGPDPHLLDLIRTHF